MFDTMTVTKVVGGLCGTLLVFLLAGWASETIYHGGAGGHGENAQAYVIAVEDDAATDETAGETTGEPAEDGSDFAGIYASADAAAGEVLWRNCRACHSIEPGRNGVGPSLYGVVGRPVDTAEGFNYSGALEQVVDVWTPEHLNGFLTDPRGYAPGTAMTYSGMRAIEDRANLIAYLDSVDG